MTTKGKILTVEELNKLTLVDIKCIVRGLKETHPELRVSKTKSELINDILKMTNDKGKKSSKTLSKKTSSKKSSSKSSLLAKRIVEAIRLLQDKDPVSKTAVHKYLSATYKLNTVGKTRDKELIKKIDEELVHLVDTGILVKEKSSFFLNKESKKSKSKKENLLYIVVYDPSNPREKTPTIFAKSTLEKTKLANVLLDKILVDETFAELFFSNDPEEKWPARVPWKKANYLYKTVKCSTFSQAFSNDVKYYKKHLQDFIDMIGGEETIVSIKFMTKKDIKKKWNKSDLDDSDYKNAIVVK